MVIKATGWTPKIGAEAIIKEIALWIKDNQNQLEGILK